MHMEVQVQEILISHVYYVDMNDALSVTRKLLTILWLPRIKSVTTFLDRVYRKQHSATSNNPLGYALLIIGIAYKITKLYIFDASTCIHL